MHQKTMAEGLKSSYFRKCCVSQYSLHCLFQVSCVIYSRLDSFVSSCIASEISCPGQTVGGRTGGSVELMARWLPSSAYREAKSRRKQFFKHGIRFFHFGFCPTSRIQRPSVLFRARRSYTSFTCLLDIAQNY